MTEEGLNASILRLQSFVIETYGMIKDVYRRQQQEGDVDKIAQLSMKLAQYEGALLTLRGYKQDIINSAAIEDEEDSEQPEEESEEESEEEQVITEEYLETASPTYRKSQKHRKKGKTKK